MAYVTDARALFSGATWNGAEVTKRPVFVTYSFPTSLPDYQEDEFSKAGFRGLTAREQADARRALAAWDKVSGIHFLEVDPGKGDINFGVYDFRKIAGMSETSGFALFPDVRADTYASLLAGVPDFSWDFGGDVFLDRASGTSFSVMLHEIGHAIGLKHPFEAEPGHKEILNPRYDTSDVTVMSYTWTSDVLAGLGILDVDAVQTLYGTARLDGRQVASWSFDSRTDTLTQTGFSRADAILGISTADRIEGGKGNDTLAGFTGDDTLSGSAGDDVLFGGAGDDLLLPGTGQNIIDGGAGFDTLSHAGYGRGLAITLETGASDGVTRAGSRQLDTFGGIEAVIGTAYNDTLTGNGGTNVLEGGAGRDALIGTGGQDTASYAHAAIGVRVSLARPSLNTGDARGDSFRGIEHLAGSAFSDRLTGDAVRNRLEGGAGNDLLDGGAGADVLAGGTGRDAFLFSTALGGGNVDRLTDFDPVRDTIQLDSAIFSTFRTPGPLSRGHFRDLASGSAERSDRILYESRSGALYYDADGATVGHGAVKIAVLANKADLSAADFLIV